MVVKLRNQTMPARDASTALAALNAILRVAGVGVSGWIGYQLIRQNGQLLVRLESMQERLDALDQSVPAPAEPVGLLPGTQAPDFELPDLNGQRVSLQSLQGDRLLLMFFDPGCGFCRRMAPDLAKMPVDGRDGHPVPVVVTTGDRETNRQLVEEHGIRCTVLLQERREVAGAYRAIGTPSGYLIDESGKISSRLEAGAPRLLELAEGSAAPQEQHDGHVAGVCGGTAGPARTYRGVENSRLLRTGLAPGTPAPDFRLPDLSGGEVTLEQYRGRRVLLVFSDPNCGPCNELAPRLQALHQTNPTINVVMISRGERDENRRKVREHDLSFPVLLQSKWEMSRAYGMFATPIGYLIDEGGRIACDVATGVEGIMGLVPSDAFQQMEPARA